MWALEDLSVLDGRDPDTVRQINALVLYARQVSGTQTTQTPIKLLKPLKHSSSYLNTGQTTQTQIKLLKHNQTTQSTQTHIKLLKDQ